MSFIEKEIIINPYISSCTYNFGKDNSRSYVVNEKLQNEFVFDGIVSDLWNLILNFKNPPPLQIVAKQPLL